jgi:hypothetical protein
VIVDVESFQPTTTTFVSAANCALAYVVTTVFPLTGTALAC